jgi:hydrogenase expression/formation protein HypC
MCIGIPMQVRALTPGYALCEGRGGEFKQLNTALVGELQLGDWVLAFLDSAQERLSPERAAEINTTLEEMWRLMASTGAVGAADTAQIASFDLPSRLSRDELLALSGQS